MEFRIRDKKERSLGRGASMPIAVVECQRTRPPLDVRLGQRVPRTTVPRKLIAARGEAGRSMFERLGGTQIVRNEGHFGDIDDPYPSFELVDRLMD